MWKYVEILCSLVWIPLNLSSMIGVRPSAQLTLLALGVWAFWGVRCYYRTTDWADADAITLNDGLRSLRSARGAARIPEL